MNKSKRRTLTIDELESLRVHAKSYVDSQLATMKEHGGAPELTPEQYEQLIVDCMKPAIEAQRWLAHPQCRR